MNWPSRLLISAYAFSSPFSLMNTTALFTMATASSLVAFSAANDDPPMRAAKTGAAIIHTNIPTRIISHSYPPSALTPPRPSWFAPPHWAPPLHHHPVAASLLHHRYPT